MAVYKIDASITKIQYLLSQSSDSEDEALEKIVQFIGVREDEIKKSFEIVEKSDLADDELVKSAIKSYEEWTAIRKKIIMFAKKGNIIEADDLVANAGNTKVNQLGQMMQNLRQESDKVAN